MPDRTCAQGNRTKRSWTIVLLDLSVVVLTQFALMWSPVAASEPTDSQRPNVLFIAIDDLNDWIGCMGGNPQTKTPNLDRFAAKGMLFTNAHCPAPACNPSRSAIFTGRAPNRSGLYDNRQQMREIMPDEAILPQYFRNHGYHAAGSGKLLHYFIDAASWDEYFPDAQTENPFPQTHYPAKRPVNLKRGGPWQYVETDWAALDVTDEEFGGDWAVSGWIASQLHKEHDKPFFLGCGIYRPHEPWFVPKKYFEPFPLNKIQLPPGYLEGDLEDVPDVGQRAARNRYFAHIREQKQWRKGLQGYLASIHFADAMLGRVLDALESGPNANNTIVVLWSDHGWQLGEKEHWQKYTPWRAVTRVPLMVHVPGSLSDELPAGTRAGTRCDQPVNLLSLFPTLLELCQLPAKPNNDGPSLVSLLQDPDSDKWTHDSVTFLSKPGDYAISGRTHRYIHYANGSEELYDIREDPYEWRNLATLPDAQEQLSAFRKSAPKEFAERKSPSVQSLAKLTWHSAEKKLAPASKPDGNPFPVHFINQRRQSVELCWMDREGKPKSYGTVGPGKTKSQQTRPGAVWMVRSVDTKQQLGHFVIGDRSAQAVIPASRPNVVIIFSDDQGWADLSCQGQLTDVQTPHIDALAERGVRCTSGYVTSPQCSPSRAGLMTGMHPQRIGIDNNADMPLPSEATTMAERLKPLGYKTGFVGKWHLAPDNTSTNWLQQELPTLAKKPQNSIRIPWEKLRRFSPAAQGFDEYYWGSRQDYRVNFRITSGKGAMAALLPEMKQVHDKRFRIDVQTQAGLDFIERNHKSPFYLQLNYFGPHTPLEAPEQYLSRFSEELPTRRRYALATISAIDDGVGKIIAKLQKHGLQDNTLVIVTSDNGAPLKMTKPDSPIGTDLGGWNGSSNEPWVGEKGMLSEGGIRVPMIWSMPSQLPRGKDYHWPVSTLDIAPSVLQIAGGDVASASQEFDGISLVSRFNDIQNPSTRTLYFRFGDQAALRQGKWKYIFVGDDNRYLFNLESDQHERENLADQYPDLAAKLHAKLKRWCDELQPAGLPTGKNIRERPWYDFYFKN